MVYTFPVPVKNPLTESFKSEIPQSITKSLSLTMPSDVGEPHNFDKELCENTYRQVGIMKSAVDKHIDFIISPGFYVTSTDKKAETLINQWIQDVSFEQPLRQWILEALTKGNSYMELSEENKQLNVKVTNACWMFNRRDIKGEIIGYSQYFGKKELLEKNKIIPFNLNQIAYLTFNQIGDCSYGTGMVYPALKKIDQRIKADEDMHMILNRKANNPYFFKLGKEGEPPPTQSDIDAVGKKLEWLTNYHEWVFDYRMEAQVLDFGNVGDKFEKVLEFDSNELFYIFQIPSVLMGTANVPEGLAIAQLDAFQRHIQSLQSAIEKVVEEQIFKRLLRIQGKEKGNDGLDIHVEMHWGQPSEEAIN